MRSAVPPFALPRAFVLVDRITLANVSPPGAMMGAWLRIPKP
jgi:hypothetical protein